MTLKPGDSKIVLQQCNLLANEGKTIEAVRKLKSLALADPQNVEVFKLLSRLLRLSGDLSGAKDAAEKAFRLDPQDGDAAYALGLCHLTLNEYDQAIRYLVKASKTSSEPQHSLYALAIAQEAVGQPWQAFQALRRNLVIDPHPRGYLKYAQLLLALGDTAGAVPAAENSMVDPVLRPYANIVLAEAYADDDPVRSEKHLAEALSAAPQLEDTYWNGRAKRLSRSGKIEEAREINLRLIHKHPNLGVSYLNWVTITRVGPEHQSLLQSMIDLASSNSLSWQECSFLQYALGKAFDDLGDYERAIHHYDQANLLRFQNESHLKAFDNASLERRINVLCKTYSPEFISRYRTNGNSSDKPLFIVGMMRTGTTLLEQILSWNPQIASGGELAHWSYAEPELVDFSRSSINRTLLNDSAREFLEILDLIDKEAPRVTDKNPANIMQAGLISIAFPQAHIIQMERDLIDTAMSIYITPTRNAPAFGCNRRNIVSAIKQTQRLCEHWKAVLPNSHYHVLKYEAMVTEPEKTVRALTDKLDLDWGATAFAPNGNSIVGTPSLWQARQPVTSAAIGRSKRYGKWLEEFEELA